MRGFSSMGFLKKFTKQEISWMMYDWANSAHSVIVVTILPIFFDTVAGYTADSVSSMSTWGFATSLAMAIVALSAPFLGVFGDIRGMRKKLFTAFMLIGVVSVAGLSFTPFMDFTASPDAAGCRRADADLPRVHLWPDRRVVARVQCPAGQKL